MILLIIENKPAVACFNAHGVVPVVQQSRDIVMGIKQCFIVVCPGRFQNIFGNLLSVEIKVILSKPDHIQLRGCYSLCQCEFFACIKRRSGAVCNPFTFHHIDCFTFRFFFYNRQAGVSQSPLLFRIRKKKASLPS